MRFPKQAKLLPAILLVLMPFMQGCGNFWQAPSGGSGSGGGTSTTLSSGVFYVANQTAKDIVAYQINSGSLTTINSYPLNSAPYAIAITPGNSFLYVATITGIYFYTIGSGGGLTAGNQGSAISNDFAQAIAVDPSGNWLVDAVAVGTGASAQVTLNAISINSSNGGLNSNTEQTQTFNVAYAAVKQMAISGDGNYVFLALAEGGTLVDIFAKGDNNPLGGRANTIATTTTGASALSIAVDPGTTPRLFYVGESEAVTGPSGGLRAFEYSSLASNTATEISGSPYASGGLAPAAILPDPTGAYVYVASGQGAGSNGILNGFNISTSTANSQTTYSLSSISTIATGIQPTGLAEDANSNFVFATAQGGSDDLDIYIFDSTTLGKLDASNLSTSTGSDPTGAIAVAALTQ